MDYLSIFYEYDKGYGVEYVILRCKYYNVLERVFELCGLAFKDPVIIVYPLSILFAFQLFKCASTRVCYTRYKSYAYR